MIRKLKVWLYFKRMGWKIKWSEIETIKDFSNDTGTYGFLVTPLKKMIREGLL